jgi:hypothetical protein
MTATTKKPTVTEASHCPRTAELAPDLALGLLTGEERAEALAHVDRCDDCRTAMNDLADVADELLVLAPSTPPPPGFESAVLATVTAGHPEVNRPRARRRRMALVAGGLAAAVVVVVVALVMGLVGGSDPGRPREAVMVAAEGDGQRVGTVSIDDRHPAWVLVSMPGWTEWLSDQDGPVAYRLRLDLEGGGHVELPDLRLAADGTWGGTTDVDADDVEAVAILDESGRIMCRGRLA